MAIDLKRSILGREMGNKPVDANAVFQAGMISQYASDGEIVTCDGTAPCGVFKWNKTSTVTGVEVKEAIVLTGTTASNLNHANVSNVKVENAAGTDYIVTTDYTVNTTNGTVTRNGAGGITSGATVYVTYTYQLSSAELNAAGKNFTLSTDDTQGSNKITIIQGFSTVYTDQYDTSKDYAVGDTVYPTVGGKFTNQADYNKPFGKVISVPTAADPYLGIEGLFTNDR